MQKGAIFTIVSQATTLLVLFVQKVDDAIRLKNLDPVDSAIGFPIFTVCCPVSGHFSLRLQ